MRYPYERNLITKEKREKPYLANNTGRIVFPWDLPFSFNFNDQIGQLVA